MSGGNVCAIAQKRGIVGLLVDRVIRDVAEVRQSKLPVFARGIMPKPGVKQTLGTLNESIVCGRVRINSGDIIIADEEEIAVIPQEEKEQVYKIARARANKDASETLEAWSKQHQAKIEEILRSTNFKDS